MQLLCFSIRCPDLRIRTYKSVGLVFGSILPLSIFLTLYHFYIPVSYPSITVGVVSISYPFRTHSPGLRIIRIISTLSLICIYLIWRVLIYDSSVSSISVGLFFRNLISSTYVISPLTNHFPPISLVLNLYPFLVDKLSVSLLYL